MPQDTPPLYLHLPPPLVQVLQGEYAQPMVYDLVNEFLAQTSYSREFTCRMIDQVIQDNLPFDVAMLCALMIENQLFKIAAEDSEEWAVLLIKLGLMADNDAQGQVSAAVLLEGYTSTALPEFVRQFRRRLGRAQRIHDAIQGAATSVSALQTFIQHTRQPCKVTLARYVLTPDKVVEQILTQVKHSYGVQHRTTPELPDVEPEAEHTRRRLPAYERAILERLCAASSIYWVYEGTSAALHALVENPLGTVVIVVKPPGSDIELEVKRTGVRGPQPLQVVYSRQGRAVPAAHRLHGGSMARLLSWEAQAAALFARIYRTVHEAEAPLSKTVAMATIYKVPTEDGEAYLTDYLTAAHIFGAGFEAMRTAMAQAVAAFDRENDATVLDIPGDLGLTLRFLSHVAPRQSLLIGSSSFRIDRLVHYLSAAGPQQYFTTGLQRAYTAPQAQGFADALLEEILGVYTPPGLPYAEHAHYIRTALAMPENRRRANKNYRSVMQQLGRVWGTLLALHGYTRGESFVSRNVGLKSVWEQGEWQVKLLLMDHDDLHVMGTTAEPFRARTYLYGVQADAHHMTRLSGDLQDASGTGRTGLLADLYQVDQTTRRAGQAALQHELLAAYGATRTAITQHPDLQALFEASALDILQEWDQLVQGYMAVRHHPGQVGLWRETTHQQLTTHGYREGTIRDYIDSLERCQDFLARYPFLY